MGVRLTAEFKVAAYFIVTTAVVIVTGVLAFRNLNRLTESIEKSNASEIKLLILKGINTDMASAESYVKSFALTSENDYLLQYNATTLELSEKLMSLDSLTIEHATQHAHLATMTSLIKEKVSLLEGYVELEKRGLVINELNALANKLDERKNEVNTKKIPEEKKEGVFKRLFKRKSKRNEEKKRNPEELKKKQLELLDEMKKDVNAVKRKQSSTLKTFDNHELSLTQRNKLLSEQIRAEVTAMEVIEINEANALVVANEQKHKETNRMIALFSVATCILLLSMTWILYHYLRKRKLYEIGLIAARNEAQNYSAMQEIFLANMSHEVRTPINAISGFTEQLLHTTLSTQQKTYTDIIRKSVRHLLVIVDDILDYSKLKAGKLRIEQISFSPVHIAEEVKVLLLEQAARKKIKLTLHIEKTVPAFVSGDPVRYKQILLNLTGNAIKFTPEGFVDMHIGYQDGKLSTVIQDTGIGIEKENLSRIFEAFEQEHNSTSRVYGGSGLGLAITKRLTELMKGTMQFVSEPNKGTTVEVLLPFAPASSADEPQQTQMAINRTQVNGLHILIADDEEWNVKLLQVILNPLGVKLACVADGKEALQLIKQELFDIALIDMRMPGMNGIELTKAIRDLKDEKKSLLPVIMLTASGNADVEACREAGVNALLVKPFDEEVLMSQIVQATKGNQLHDIQTSDYVTTAQQHADDLPEYNLHHLIRLAGSDTAFLHDMILTFVRNLKATLTECDTLIKNQNYDAVYERVHKIIAPCRFIEAQKLVDHFLELELLVCERKQHESLDVLNQIEKYGLQLTRTLEEKYLDYT